MKDVALRCRCGVDRAVDPTAMRIICGSVTLTHDSIESAMKQTRYRREIFTASGISTLLCNDQGLFRRTVSNEWGRTSLPFVLRGQQTFSKVLHRPDAAAGLRRSRDLWMEIHANSVTSHEDEAAPIKLRLLRTRKRRCLPKGFHLSPLLRWIFRVRRSVKPSTNWANYGNDSPHRRSSRRDFPGRGDCRRNAMNSEQFLLHEEPLNNVRSGREAVCTRTTSVYEILARKSHLNI